VECALYIRCALSIKKYGILYSYVSRNVPVLWMLIAYCTLKLKVCIRCTKHHTVHVVWFHPVCAEHIRYLVQQELFVFVSFVQVMVIAAVTVAAWSKVCCVFICPAGGIGWLNPFQSMVACLYFFSVHIVLLMANKTCWMATNKIPKLGK